MKHILAPKATQVGSCLSFSQTCCPAVTDWQRHDSCLLACWTCTLCTGLESRRVSKPSGPWAVLSRLFSHMDYYDYQRKARAWIKISACPMYGGRGWKGGGVEISTPGKGYRIATLSCKGWKAVWWAGFSFFLVATFSAVSPQCLFLSVYSFSIIDL